MRRIISITLLFPIFLLYECKKEEYSYEPPVSGIVKYQVTCNPYGFDITYENSDGNTEQKDISGGSWTTTFTGYSGQFVYISAQADNENADISVKIYYRGELIESANSSGDYVIATASGSLP